MACSKTAEDILLFSISSGVGGGNLYMACMENLHSGLYPTEICMVVASVSECVNVGCVRVSVCVCCTPREAYPHHQQRVIERDRERRRKRERRDRGGGGGEKEKKKKK